MRSSLSRVGMQTAILVIGLLLTIFVVWIMRKVLDAVTNLHWLLGLIIAVAIIAALIWILRWIRNASFTPADFGQYPKIGLTLNLFFIVVVAILAMAIISDTLYRHQLIQYSSSDPITAARLLDYYGWHFFDSIPVLAIWDVFDVQARIDGEGIAARALVQLFRVLIAASAIQLFLSKRGDFRRQLKVAQKYRIKKDYKLAQRTLEDAMKSAKRRGETINQADVHLEFARLYLDQESKHEVLQHLARALKLIDQAENERDLESRRREVQELGSENSFLEHHLCLL